MHLMKPTRDVGIAGYGAYVPRFRLPATEVSRVWTGGSATGPIREKAVPGLDEDVASMSIEAVRNALARGRIDPAQLGAVWVGSESHPYAVKPTGTIVAEAVGATPATLAADWQFACKAGTEAIQGSIGLVGSNCVRFACGVGMDTAQGRPGDALEYTAGAGGAAIVIGPAEESLAVLEGSLSYVTDTPDFWRRQHARYPEHGARFTGVPAYFKHIGNAGAALLEALESRPSDYAHAVFHQPNEKFPAKAGKDLGFSREQLRVGQLANEIGNTYAGAAIVGFTAILDEAKPGDRILVVSFGSGAGADAFSFRVTDRIADMPRDVPTTRQYIARRVELDYANYARHRRKIAVD
jgi:hydroxymethylglutaryl-CoA synthase